MIFDDWGYSTWKFDALTIRDRLSNVRIAIDRLQKSGIKFDAFAVHGTSGTWLAPLLIMEGYAVVMIRKKGEQAHGSRIEGPSGIDIKRLVIIDDFICTGRTIRRIIETAHQQGPMSVVAIILHDADRRQNDSFDYIPIFHKDTK
jgi:orotate phosphoribosyltransferase-like protein